MADREKILDRIAKLQALAGDRAATPEEAAAAAEAIARIIREHGLDDVDLGAAGVVHADVETGREKRQAIDALAPFVAWACGCVMVNHRDGNGYRIVYVGPDPAPSIATYLHAVCYRAVESAAAEFRQSVEYRKRRKASTRAAALKAFKAGMIERLGGKLARLGWLTKDQRDRLFIAYERRTGTTLGTAAPLKRPAQTKRYADARGRGHEAGSQVDIHRPIETGDDVKLIGRAG